MAIMTEPGTEKRVDDLRSETHQGFNRIDADIRELRSATRAGFDRVDDRFHGVHREFTAVRSEMKAGFDKVDDEFKSVRAEMKEGFDGMQRQMTRFFAGTLGTVVAGVIVTVVTVLAHS